MGKKVLFRGFYESDNGTKTITINGLQIKGEWVYWNVFGKLTTSNGKVQRYEKKTCYGTIVYYDRADQLHILKETIGQYTGLSDLSDKKIFGGDIILEDGKYKRYIMYCETYTAFCKIRYIDEEIAECLGYFGKGFDNYKLTYKVIGNIWENPELIKENEQ